MSLLHNAVARGGEGRGRGEGEGGGGCASPGFLPQKYNQICIKSVLKTTAIQFFYIYKIYAEMKYFIPYINTNRTPKLRCLLVLIHSTRLQTYPASSWFHCSQGTSDRGLGFRDRLLITVLLNLPKEWRQSWLIVSPY